MNKRIDFHWYWYDCFVLPNKGGTCNAMHNSVVVNRDTETLTRSEIFNKQTQTKIAPI